MSPSSTPKKAVHFGAGNIGRGFVACFLHNSGYEVVFADVGDKVCDLLNTQPTYKVIEVGAEGTTEKTIANYRAINSRRYEDRLIDEIATADVVTCSVGPNILKFLAPIIAKGIAKRPEELATPTAVIACENAIGATDTLAGFIREQLPANVLEGLHSRARFANSAIDRIVPAQDPDAGLNVKLEKFYEWVVDRTPFADHAPPSIDGIYWVDNLEPFIERKLYTVNTGHATAAYHGYNRQKRTVYDALQDKEIHAEVRRALDNTSTLITTKHGIDPEEQRAYVRKILTRIGNPHLEDAVERVGRAPLRKLSRKERFVGPAAELAEKGEDFAALLAAAEMAFRFQDVDSDDESKELARIMAEKHARDVVSDVCGLHPHEKLYDHMVEVVQRVQQDSVDDSE